MTDRCTGCDATVRHVLTVEGRRIAIDPDPDPDGVVVVQLVDGQPRARILTGEHLPALEAAWTLHRTRCTASPEGRARAARLQPRCTVCQLPMDADLARLEHWTCHPSCEPARPPRKDRP